MLRSLLYENGFTIGGARQRLSGDVAKDDVNQSQQIIRQAMAAENAISRAEFEARNAEALFTLRQTHKVDMRRFSDGVLKELGVASGDVVSALGTGGDGLTRRIYEDFRKFRSKALSWSHLGEQSFLNARILPFKY